MEEGSETTQTHARSKIFQEMQQSKTCSSNTMTISNMHATSHIRFYVVSANSKMREKAFNVAMEKTQRHEKVKLSKRALVERRGQKVMQ